LVDFTLTDEQKDLRELAHDFAEKEIRPVAWDYDRDSTWPQEVIDKAFEVGLMNVHIPEAYGGPGLDYLSGCLIEEHLGWGLRHRHHADGERLLGAAVDRRLR
jgi:acyl-CoA dehydrogenase